MGNRGSGAGNLAEPKAPAYRYLVVLVQRFWWEEKNEVPQAPRSDTGHRLALLPARS